MYEEIAVHIADGCGIERIRDCVEKATGEKLKESFDEVYGRYFETSFNKRYFTTVKDFSADPFCDVNGLPFSRLPVMASFAPYKTPPGAEEREELCREIAMRVAKAVFEELHYDCVVVEDDHRLVGTFKSPENEWLVQGPTEPAPESKTISGLQGTSEDALARGLAGRIMYERSQATHYTIYVWSQAGMTEAIARRAIVLSYAADNTLGKLIQSIRISGKGFDITLPRMN